ncbi:MAG: beta-mannosidase, partial [Prevotella sp.]|nr:beta-mannosidase [Prevotella sp.]
MKKLMFVVAMAALCMACQQQVEQKTASQQLLERLTAIQKHGYMFGHQDDTFYGLTWEYLPDSSDILATVGDYPAVMGFDLGG